ncbi:MAG TPA: dihydrodipicolinate synthase family protein [Bryobacteraceae bacterium]|nr:dihydrodipicolinate synthase family protein [Bryobacteraceae bacterium]
MKKPSRAESDSGLRGVVAAALTPRRAGESKVDLAALLETVDFLCAAGVNGIVLFGSTGEFPHFDAGERARALSLAVKRSRCPVFANVSHSNLDAAVALADEAAGAGADGVLLMPPIYFRYDQETVCQYFLTFLEAVHGILPAYLYNIPLFATGVAVETVAALIAAGYGGIKDSSGDPEYFARLLETCGASGARLLTGSEQLYGRFRAAGAAGVVSGVASAVPELLVHYEQALSEADEPRIARLAARIGEFISWCDQFPAPMIVREAALLRRVPAGCSATPLGPALEARREEFRAWFPAWWRTAQSESVS